MPTFFQQEMQNFVFFAGFDRRSRKLCSRGLKRTLWEDFAAVSQP
jgi:hypothetical protein